MMYLITAMTKTGIIGVENKLPWNIPVELKNFKRLTLDQTVVMGRRTFESIGKPLPQRYNIVLSTPDLVIPDEQGIVCQTIDQAIQAARLHGKNIFIIGGANTYAQFLPLVDRLIISHIKADYQGNVYFPPIDWSLWKIIEHVDYSEFELITYARNTKSK